MTPAQRELLRRLALNDVKALNVVISASDPQLNDLLDDKTRSLVRLAGVITVGAEETSLRAAIDTARCSGARDQEIVETALSIASMVGATNMGTVLPVLSSMIGSD